jgi:hypothetical protein
MPESSPTIMIKREASILAQNLVSYTAGGPSIMTRVVTLEGDARAVFPKLSRSRPLAHFFVMPGRLV